MKNLYSNFLKVILAKSSKEFARLFYMDDLKKKKDEDFIKTFYVFKKKSEKCNQRFKLEEEDVFPCYDDNTGITSFDTHYIYHPAWAARILQKTRPLSHVDISSTLHFCSIISAFLPVKFYDFRPAKLTLSDLSSESANLTLLHFQDNSIASLSCMHTIEHIGLGRYGDPIDCDGDIKAVNELKRVLAVGGNLLIVLPVGKSKIMFNAHRIYSYSQVIEMFSELRLEEFSLVPDDALTTGMVFNASEELSDRQSYGCGCFWFKKVNA